MARVLCAVFRRGCPDDTRLQEAHETLRTAQRARRGAEHRVRINEERNTSNHYALDVGDALRIGRT